MIIKYLKLINFGKHKNLEFKNIELGSVIGLFGKNGAGKSHVLTAIDFAFTRRLPDTVSSYIHNGEKSGCVELVFIKNGKEGKIIRKLGKSTSSVLEWDGVKLDKTAEIDNKINEILGVDKQMLDNTVFIKQGAIADLLTETPSKRLELITRLLNLDFISKRFQLLDKKQEELKESVENIGLLKDEVVSKKARLEQDKVDLENKISLANSKYISEQFLIQLREKIIKFKNKSSDIEKLESELEALRLKGISEEFDADRYKSCDELKSQINEFREKLKELTTKYANYADVAVRAEQTLSSCDEVKSFLNLYSEIGGVSKLKEDLANYVNLKNSKIGYDKCSSILSKAKEDIQAWNKEIEATSSQLKDIIDKLKNEDSTISINSILLSNLKTLYETKLKLKDKLKKDNVVCPICGLKLLLGQEVTNGEVESVKTGIGHVEQVLNEANKRKSDLSYKKQELENISAKCHAELRRCNLVFEESTASIKELEFAKDANLDDVNSKIDNYKRVLDSFFYKRSNIQDKFNFVASEIYTLQQQNMCILKDIVDEVSDVKIEKLKEDIDNISNKASEVELKWCDLQKEKVSVIKDVEKYKLLLKSMDLATKEKLALNLAESIDKIDNNEKFLDIDTILNQSIPEGLEVYKNIEVEKSIIEKVEEDIVNLNSKIAEIENKNNKVYSTIASLEAIKNIISIKEPNSIPRAYIDYLFNYIINSASNLLFKMNSNFIIEADSECCSFKFKRIDIENNYWMPMSKLSGGQRVKLAIVLLLAIHEIICPELGLLVLDEPSTHLDQDSVDALAETFIELSKVLKGRRSQLWIVDHNSTLSSCSDLKLVI